MGVANYMKIPGQLWLAGMILYQIFSTIIKDGKGYKFKYILQVLIFLFLGFFHEFLRKIFNRIFDAHSLNINKEFAFIIFANLILFLAITMVIKKWNKKKDTGSVS